MLVRFIIENVFSFGERRELSMIPYGRLQTLTEHKYKLMGLDILKMASIYGANGAGKSNLVKSLFVFQNMVLQEEIPFRWKGTQFKLAKNDKNKSQLFAIEFIQDGSAFYYAIELLNNLIVTEELYESGLGKEQDKLIFERKTNTEKKTDIIFSQEFEKDEKNRLLKSLLIEEFVKPNEPILKIISNRDNEQLRIAKKAYKWFNETLQIILPGSKPMALADRIDKETEFQKYAQELMCSFNLGITSLESEKKGLQEFWGKNNKKELDQLIQRLENSPSKMMELVSDRGIALSLVKEKNKFWVKQLKVGHSGPDNENIIFNLDEESDGTIRLLDFVPAFKDVISMNKVFIVDEIERSIHPLLIKELVTKFSKDDSTKGQIIFTTHESNLLDQEIFRLDEIWFVEKDINGSTDLYSLSEYKEHKTIDIRKGYLNGRYGSIPFLANLKDLNWHKYDFKK